MRSHSKMTWTSGEKQLCETRLCNEQLAFPPLSFPLPLISPFRPFPASCQLHQPRLSIRHSMAGICNSSPLQGVAGTAFSLHHHFVPLWQETSVCTFENVLTNWITSNCQSQTSIIFDPYTNEIVCLLASPCEVPVAFCQLRAMLYMCKFTVLRPCRVSQDHDKVAPYPEKPWKGKVKRLVHTGSRMF